MAAGPKEQKGGSQTASENLSDLSFEQVITRLQEVVGRLEQGDLPLEQSLRVFEEGIALSRLGTKKLDEAEHRVEVLLNGENGVETRPANKEPQS